MQHMAVRSFNQQRAGHAGPGINRRQKQQPTGSRDAFRNIHVRYSNQFFFVVPPDARVTLSPVITKVTEPSLVL